MQKYKLIGDASLFLEKRKDKSGFFRSSELFNSLSTNLLSKMIFRTWSFRSGFFLPICNESVSEYSVLLK